MTTLVTENGFAPATHPPAILRPESLPANDDGNLAMSLEPGDELNGVAIHLHRMEFIQIAFPSFADGRGFTLARRLRLMGFTGRLRATGHVLADQFAMALRAGFDEVEISDDLAARQTEDQWLARANWREHDYQRRLRG